MRKTLRGQRNQCPTCAEYFNSNAAFDKHRVGSFAKGERRCLAASEMLEEGMVLNGDGFWVGSPMPENARIYPSMDA